jgi:hypothetical protein
MFSLAGDTDLFLLSLTHTKQSEGLSDILSFRKMRLIRNLALESMLRGA